MARTPTTFDHSDLENQLNGGIPAADLAAVAPLMTGEHARAIAQEFGDGLPYQRDRVVRECQFFMAQSADAMLEAGRRLIEIKENEPHGEFVEIVEGRLGLQQRSAQMMMKATLKFSSPALASKAKSISFLGKTKLYDLMLMDDEPLAQLAEGGTVAGLTLDSIDRMSSRELRAALRDARENEQAAGRLMAEKDARVNDLATKLTRAERRKAVEIEQHTPDERLKALMDECTTRAFHAEADVRGNLRIGIEAVLAHCTAHGGSADAFVAGLLAQVERAIRDVREQYRITATPEAITEEERLRAEVVQWAGDLVQ
jgi:hypothetical protein